MPSGITCVVTIHGVGFQQPPTEDTPGYADDLHTYLCSALNTDGKLLLSDDPNRQPYQHGDSVPIYVEGLWTPTKICWEKGLRRLGTWIESDNNWPAVSHDASQALVKGGARIAHVALVYSGLEGEGPQLEAALLASLMTTLCARRYIDYRGELGDMFHISQAVKQALQDEVNNLLHHQQVIQPTTSLRVRQDAGYPAQSIQQGQFNPSGSMSILRQLENDVATYVCHNGRRQRVRSFVQDALMRLVCRDDVSGIILNTHSNGTVIGLDAVEGLPLFADRQIRAFITAGSPLLKYVDLFSWGTYIGLTPVIDRWWNFQDKEDFVADPLNGLYHGFDPVHETIVAMSINDIPVNNVENSPPGGLRAHNYWDNTKEFIPKVVSLLNDVVAAEDATANKAVPAGSQIG
jgi:hypothetical protein